MVSWIVDITDMFPCFKCGNPYDQMSDIYNYTSLKGVKYSNLWYDHFISFIYNLQAIFWSHLLSLFFFYFLVLIFFFLFFSFFLPSFLPSFLSLFGRIEVEDPEYWGTVSENVGFFQQLIDAGEHLGRKREERGEGREKRKRKEKNDEGEKEQRGEGQGDLRREEVKRKTNMQKGILMGIHTSSPQWTLILGNSTAGSIYPLWYTHTISSLSFFYFV